MNHGVLFVDENGIKKHSYDDWGLLFAPFEKIYPEPKTDYILIEGGHGDLDLTEEYGGKIFYNDTNFNMTFKCHDNIRYETLLDEIGAFLHGKKMKVYLYYDPDYYYSARVKVNKYASNKAMGEIVLSLKAHPFKLRKIKTIEIIDVVDKKVVAFKNNRMETTPTFKSDNEMVFKWNGGSYTINQYETTYPQVEFVEGSNIIEFLGNGRVTVSYQEGKF